MADSTKEGKASPGLANGGDRRQERSRVTRLALLAAARCVFIHDGFELARIEDIATAAGKTRGAFYANFEDKEDIFFALMEAEMERDLKAVRRRLEASTSPEQHLEQLARHMLSVCRNKRRMLLVLEFKLYAIRHPRQQQRLAHLHAVMATRCADMRIDHLLPALRAAGPRQKRRQTALFSAVLDGLTLNRLFDPRGLDKPAMLHLLRATIAIAGTGAKEVLTRTRALDAVHGPAAGVPSTARRRTAPGTRRAAQRTI